MTAPFPADGLEQTRFGGLDWHDTDWPDPQPLPEDLAPVMDFEPDMLPAPVEKFELHFGLQSVYCSTSQGTSLGSGVSPLTVVRRRRIVFPSPKTTKRRWTEFEYSLAGPCLGGDCWPGYLASRHKACETSALARRIDTWTHARFLKRPGRRKVPDCRRRIR